MGFRQRSPPALTNLVDSLSSSLLGVSLSDIPVDLNSDLPLPAPWEQVLNIQTGEIYYLNRRTGVKTKSDPRVPAQSSRSGSCCSNCYDDGDGRSHSENENENENENESESCASSSTSSSSSCWSTSSSASSTISTASSSGRCEVLTLVGCRVCLTLAMVAAAGEGCPKCGSHLLIHF